MQNIKPFLVYKSSAGSGKTTALIHIFLDLMLSQPDPDHFKRVLAITFTNKATNEMKERLLKELIDISGIRLPYDAKNEGFMAKKVMETTGLEPAELKRRASNAFIRILFDYGDLAISTIDRFNHKLIRAFSKELDLRTDFAVELDDTTLFKEAVLRLVERVGQDDTVTEHLTKFITAAQDDERRANITKNLENLKPLIMKEEADAPLEALRDIDETTFNSIVDELSTYCRKIETEFRTIGQKAKKLLDDAGATSDDIAYKSTGWYTYFEKCLTDPIGDLKISERRRNAIDEPWAHKKADPATAAAIDAVTTSLVEFAEKAITLYDNEVPGYLLRKAVLKNIHLLGTLNELREALDEITEERNILPISYFNRLVSKHLRNEPAAFIYENIGARYDNILIDEFQDTSALQWLNLLPLVGEALSTNKTALVVGDAKQSIYRWRGGKAEQLVALPKIDDPLEIIPPELVNRLDTAYNPEILNTNYRSAERIVTFNNALFGALTAEFTKSKSIYEEAYADVAQKINVSKPGYVEVNYLGAGAEESTSLHLLLRQVRDLEQRDVPLNDICILVRTKKEGKKISEFLESKGVMVTTSDSRSIDSDARVQMITAFLKLDVKPDDNPSKITAMRILTSLHGLPYNPDKFKVTSKGERGSNIDLRAFLKAANLPVPKRDWFTQGAYQACETLIANYLPESRTTTSLTALLNYIVSKGGMNLTTEDFVQYWDNAKDKPGAGTVENPNSVRMMTVHKSKGLQFRVVIVPSVNWKLIAGNDESWVKVDHLLGNGLRHAPLNVSSKLEGMGLGEVHEKEKSANDFDNLNIMYVALTRAKSALYINYTETTAAFSGDKFRKAMEVIESENGLLEGSEIKPLATCLLDFENDLDDAASRLAWGEPPVGKEDQKDAETDKAEVRKLPKATAETEAWFERFQFAYDPKSLGKNISQKTGIYFHRLAAETADLEEGNAWVEARSKNGEIDPEEKAHLVELAEMLYSDEKYRRITSAGRRLAEREILYKGEVLRPDLVFETDTEATVIDFKTGEEKESHLNQVVRYKTALQKATGKPTAGFLLYLDPMKWVEVQGADDVPGPPSQMELF